MDIFDYARNINSEKESPLASRLRPKTLEQVVGQEHIIGEGKLLYLSLIHISQLTELINESDEETGIQVYIGSESPVKSMKDCSVVTATYELEDGFKGTIGIIGPKRMDYEKVVETLRTVKEQLSETFKDDN